jgi:zinc transport system substrate-binding protein
VRVSSLTPPGAEPHDVELSPRQVRSVSETDLVVYLSGFQSAVDEAIEARQPERVVDAADVVDLLAGGEHTHADEDEHADEDTHSDEHADEHADEDTHADADEHADEHVDDTHADAVDPHFWLDPQRLAALAQPVADALAEADPANADTFSAAAQRLAEELGAVDAAYAAGLATCERRVVVASHEAYGYLSAAYHLEQVGISGLDPEAEPSPARLREIGDVVRERGVTTLFTETLVNPKVAETLAADLGVTTAVLDPIESQTDPAADYRAVMEQNLEALRAGLGCS